MRISSMSVPAALLLLAAAVSAAPVNLAIKFPAGQVDKFAMTMDMDQTLTSDALPTPQKQKIKMGMDMLMKVLESDDKGAKVEMTFDRMSVSMSMFNQEMAFDSAKDKPAASNPLSAIGTIVGAKLTLHFTPGGKVDKVEGVDDVVKKLSAQPGAAGAGAGQMLKQMMSEEQIKQTFNSGFAETLPGKPVDIGDTWESNVSQNVNGMAMKMKSENKLVAVEEQGGHKIAKIEFSGDGKLEGAPAGGPKVKMDQMTQKGTKLFDLDRGTFSQTDMEQKMKGSMTVPTPNGDVALKMDQSLNAKITMKPVEAK
jgi:Family of unknown function (DUF6263)